MSCHGIIIISIIGINVDELVRLSCCKVLGCVYKTNRLTLWHNCVLVLQCNDFIRTTVGYIGNKLEKKQPRARNSITFHYYYNKTKRKHLSCT